MVVRCYACDKRFKRELQFCPTCGFVNLKVQDWLPEELKQKHAENYKSKSTEPTKSEIELYLNQAAKDCKFKIGNLKIEDNFNEGVLKVLQPEDNYRNFTLSFNPRNMSIFSKDEIISLLRHEIMHPITMKEASKVLVRSHNPEIQEFQAEVQFAYDEMINYKGYVKLFPKDQNMHSAKNGMFTNFSIIFLTAKHLLEKGLFVNSPHPITQSLIVYEDAVYNFFEEKTQLANWVKEVNAQAMFKFWEWIHEDFNLIHENTSTRDEMREIIFLTTNMILSIDMKEVYLSNTLNFNDGYSHVLDQCKNDFTSNLATRLIPLWENRFQTAT